MEDLWIFLLLLPVELRIHCSKKQEAWTELLRTEQLCCLPHPPDAGSTPTWDAHFVDQSQSSKVFLPPNSTNHQKAAFLVTSNVLFMFLCLYLMFLEIQPFFDTEFPTAFNWLPFLHDTSIFCLHFLVIFSQLLLLHFISVSFKTLSRSLVKMNYICLHAWPFAWLLIEKSCNWRSFLYNLHSKS